MIITNAMGGLWPVVQSDFTNERLFPFLFTPGTDDFHDDVVVSKACAEFLSNESRGNSAFSCGCSETRNNSCRETNTSQRAGQRNIAKVCGKACGSGCPQPECACLSSGPHATNHVDLGVRSNTSAPFNYPARGSVTGRAFKLAEDGVEPFLMRKGEGLKFDANAVPAGPADCGPLDQEGNFLSRDVQKEIHFHAGEDRGGAFEPAAFAREVQGFCNGVRPVPMDQRA